MGRIDNKVVIITGGARGQGAEEARLFAAEGATVVITDVLDQEGAACAAGIPGATYLHLDVRSEAGWEQTVAAVVQACGRVDVLVNNAGIDLSRRFELTTLEEWCRRHGGIDHQRIQRGGPGGRPRARRLWQHQVGGAWHHQGGRTGMG